ncbi:unnamed protein product [Blepharisma stoltei]|uniref:Uncharacterized protein n=1 Tax=Blepharisma stoltei TaxID=1481888 RepID=A0AAU9JN85_9CILI|nr:unnamed protein product [Blepharisma stoltei]
MQKDKWIESLENTGIFESPLGTPQFSAAYKKFRHMREKASLDTLESYFNCIDTNEKHIESIISIEEASKIDHKMKNLMEATDLTDAEICNEISRMRSESENSILKLKKDYLKKEREIFQQISNEADLQVLIATRPEMLEITTKVSTSPLVTPESLCLESLSISDHLKNCRLQAFTQSLNKQTNLSSSVNPQELRSILSEIMAEDPSIITENKIQKYSEILQSAFEEDIKEKENILRSQLEKEFEADQSALASKFESQISQGIEETKTALNKFWQKKVQELDRKLKSMEVKAIQYHSQEEQGLKEFYDNLLDQKLNEQSEALQKAIIAKFKAEYEIKAQQKIAAIQKKKQTDKDTQLSTDELDRMNEEIISENEIRLYSEKEAWKKDIMPFLIEECRIIANREQDQIISKKSSELRTQAKVEIQELIDQVKKDSEAAIVAKIKEIDEADGEREKTMSEKIRAECFEELKKEHDFRLRVGLTEKLREQLQKEVRTELVRRIEMEVRLRKEDEIRKEVQESIEEEHENARKRQENETRFKIQELEQTFEENYNHLVMEEVKSKLEKREKELNIDYMRKLEKLRENHEKQYQDYQSQQIQKTKQLLNQEKAEVARLRSNLNVLLKKMTDSRKNELSLLKYQEEILERKMREVQYDQQFNEEQPSRICFIQDSEKAKRSSKSPTPNKGRSKSPFKEKNSITSPKWPSPNNDYIRTLPKPLPPPAFSSENSIKIERTQERSPKRKLLDTYNTKEIISDLILKNLENAKQHAWALLRETEIPPLIRVNESDIDVREFLSSRKTLQTNTLPSNYETQQIASDTKPKHKHYYELLNQHHGIIEPRIK